MPDQYQPPDVRDFSDTGAIRKEVLAGAMSAITDSFPYEDDNYRYEIDNVAYKGKTEYSLADQKKAILDGRSLTSKLRGRVRMFDRTSGDLVDEKDELLMHVPYYTQRGTVIDGGSEYSFINQMRLRPGVYTRRKESGEYETHVNAKAGRGFKVEMAPNTGNFSVVMGQGRMPLLAVTRAAGIDDEVMKKSLGDNLFESNANKANSYKKHDTIYKKFLGYKYDDYNTEAERQEAFKEAFANTSFDPEVMRTTTGIDTDRMGTDVMPRIVQKIIAASRGEEEMDDRDSVEFGTIHSIEDFVKERISKDAGNLRRTLAYKSRRNGNLKALGSGYFSPYMSSLVVGSGMAQAIEETNPYQLLDQQHRITKLGPGGIPSADVVTDAAREVKPSQLGFIDLVAGPECFDDKTSVLTRRGWLNWTDARDDDQFACMIDGALEFHLAERVVRSPYKGTMFGVKTKFLDHLVTPSHRCYVRPGHTNDFRIECASDTHGKSRNYLCGGPVYTGGSVTSFTLPPVERNQTVNALGCGRLKEHHTMPIGPWAKFMGYFLSEGCVRYVEEKSSYLVRISQVRDVNPEVCDDIEECLDALGFSWLYTAGNDYVIGFKQLASYLKKYGKAHEKYVPDYILEAPIGAREAFLAAAVDGDGRRNTSHHNYTSTSEQLADGVRMVATSLGYSTNKAQYSDDREKRYLDTFEVSFHKLNQRSVQRKKFYYTSEYDGMVYCATVPGSLLYVKRASGIPTWSGNSDKIGVDVRAAYKTFKGKDNKLYAEFKDTRNGGLLTLNSGQLRGKTLAFPGEDMSSPKSLVTAMRDGKVVKVTPDKIDLQIPSQAHMYFGGFNMTPLATGFQPGRAFYASKYWSQFMPVANGEAPLIQGKVPDSEQSFVEQYGRKVGTLESPAAGKVTQVTEKGVTVMDAKGKKHFVETIKNMPFNRFSLTGRTEVFVQRDSSIRRYRMDEYTYIPGDEVMSYDPKTKRSAWMPVQGYLKHRSDKRLFSVKFASGRTVECTEDHSLLTLGADGDLIPIYPEDCTIGSTRCPVVFGNVQTPADGWSRDLGVIDGLYLSEGCRSKQPGLVRIACEPEDRKTWINELIRATLNVRPHRNADGRCSFNCRATRDRLAVDFGEGAKTKTINSHVFGRGREYLQGLISGYMGGDGCAHVGSNAAVQVTGSTISKPMRDSLVQVLQLLGVHATMGNPETNGDGCHLIHKFRVKSADLHKLDNWFCFPDKQANFLTYLAGEYRASSSDAIPYPKAIAKQTYKAYPGKTPHTLYKYASEFGYIHKHNLSPCLGVWGDWAASDILWDVITSVTEIPHEPYVYDFSVKSSEAFATAHGLLVHNTGITYTPSVEVGDVINEGDMVAHSNFTDKSTGSFNMGINLRTAVIPNAGFEDAYHISESAAKKLATERLYGYDHETRGGSLVDKKNFVSLFGSKYTKEQISHIDEDTGVAREGTILRKGDPIILATSPKTLSPDDAKLGKLHKALRNSFEDKSQVWEHDYPGKVVDVGKSRNAVKVNVHAVAPVKVGDKFTNGQASKGVVGKITPDADMPVNKATGEHYEMLFNPMAVPSRVAPNQILDMQLAKVAKKNGSPLKLSSEPPKGGWNNYVKNALKENGISPTSTLVDPKEGEITDVSDGLMYLSPFYHVADKKLSTRETGGYDADEQPTKPGGKEGSAKRMCFPASQKVTTFHGELPIGHIVENRIPAQVWTCNDAGEWGFYPVTNWWCRRGTVEELLSITVANTEVRDAQSSKVAHTARTLHPTADHMIYRWNGDKVKAGELKVGDKLTTFGPVSGVSPIGSVPCYVHRIQPYKHDKPGITELNLYDLEIDTVHRYCAANVVVSNSQMNLNAMLSHGSLNLIKDAHMVRGAKNMDMWNAIRMGQPIPEPDQPFVYDKFKATLQAGGIKMYRKGDMLDITPLTDTDVTEMSSGEIETAKTVDSTDLTPYKGGLFDETITGGTSGRKWSHITLAEPLPSPVMEEPVRRLLGLTVKQYHDVLTRKENLPGTQLTGGAGIKQALADIDVPKARDEAHRDVKRLRGASRDAAVKRLRYLSNFEKQGFNPADMVITKVPVIPPAFRPISQVGDMLRPSDLNGLYRDLIEVNTAVKDLRTEVGETNTADETIELYKAVQAAAGLGQPLSPDGQAKGWKGAIRQLVGNNPKTGYIQSKMLSKTVDLSARGVITPDNQMDMDTVGIPEEQAWELYKPFIVRDLVKRGVPSAHATGQVEERSKEADAALDRVMKERPVILDRAPTWHKFNLLAFNPVRVKDKSIHLSPLVVSGFAADFDGDAMSVHVPVLDSAVKDAREGMFASKNLLSLTDLRSPIHDVGKEMSLGLWRMTSDATEGKEPVHFPNAAAVKSALEDGSIKYTDPVIIG